MRRAWLLVLACVLTAALGWLATLQVRWINAVGAAEEQAAEREMKIAAGQFAEDIGREFARATVAFQGSTIDAESLAHRFAEWSVAAREPRLIEAIYVADFDGQLSRFDPAARTFAAADWPPSLQGVRMHLLHFDHEPHGLDSGIAAIVIPLRPSHERAPLPGVAILQIDRAVLAGKLLPALAQRAFGRDFDAAVMERGAIIWSNGAAWSESAAELEVPLLPMRRMREPGALPVPPPPESVPRLLIRHRGATITEAVERGRRNNLAVSFAILGLLAGSFVLLAVLTRRAERLRLQQLEFVAGITHELNTPLAALTSAGQNLADGIVAEPRQVARYGEAIVRESRRLGDLVAQVLEFAGLQSRRRRRSEPVDVGSMIDDAIAACRWLADEHGVIIDRNVAADLPPVGGDPAALRSAVQNLVANAIRHGAEGKWVGVHAARAGDHVVIRVEDRGPGIGARDLPHLFEPFYRGRASSSSFGSGLGLTIVKRVADAHGGTIDVERRRERGAAFVLRLPAELQHA